ncbi:hypothetical protein B0T24DRAFT_532926 [Lasiosphaeria ovina]|uniref:Zn(2)-C6 fungal-type domain-containing protein n=1 Tax=Lasiosphaeria ovina TaxID=92902 RepID=A0AAE0N3R1_9PEZI|nr:hypothetical protein B0T24DRAFT_532926 [Lasiosphaeria ovina]
MEALLGADKSNYSCGSVADLQAQLRDLLGSKVTGTRAEHIAVTLKLRATTVFDVPVTETENEVLESAANIDPLLGGPRSSVAPASDAAGAPPTRKINAIDTLLNKPSDDHVLQKSLAKHVVASLSEVDGSNWTVREVSRNDQSWTFTYICKDSWQAWSRQNSKNPARTVIGEWTNKEGDFNLGRPAFDCRGSLTIAFVRSTRSIDVKYDHTPIHKTVSQLIELLAPPPPEAPPLVLNRKALKEPKPPKPPRPPRAPKPPKKPRAPKEPKAPRPPRPPRDRNAPNTLRSGRKRRAEENGVPGGESSQPKKRRKKKDSAAAIAADGTVMPPEMPSALPVGQLSERQLYNNDQSQDMGTGLGGSAAYPEGLVGSATANDTNSRSDSEAVSVNGGVHSHSVFDLAPGEAARRRDVAIKLLNDESVDRQTLSPKQFNIFANQSPELQKESLAMLVKYGAERLRIIHPIKGDTTSGQSTPSAQMQGSPADSAPSESKKSRKRRSGQADASALNEMEVEATEAAAASDKRKKTRGPCDTCRGRKTKCDKKKPSCSQCLEEGLSCYYAPAKPRQSRAAKSVEEDIEPATEPAVESVELAAVNVDMDVDDEPEDLGSPGFHTEPAELPPSELVSPPVESASVNFQHSHGMYQHSTGLTYPRATETRQPSLPPGPIEYIPTTVEDTSMQNYTYPPPAEPSHMGYTEQPATIVQQGPPPIEKTRSSRSRRSLSSGPAANVTSTNNGTGGTQLDNWQTVNQTVTTTPAPAPAPAPRLRTSPRRTRAKQSVVQESGSQGYDDVRQNSSWQTASQPVAQNTAQLAHNPPYGGQPTRAKSRQSNRAQTYTPVQSVSAARPSQPQASQALPENTAYTSTTAADSTAAAGYSGYTEYPSAQADTANNRVAYEPYTHSPPSAVPNSYSSYDSYNMRSANANSSTALSNPVAQGVTSSYTNSSTAAMASSATQWGTASSASQPRDSHSCNANPSTSSGTSSYNMSSTNTQQPQSLQGLSVRPTSTTQTRSSTAGRFNQQSQPPPPQQPQQHRQQPQQQAQSSNSYSNQSHTGGGGHQNWYGFTAVDNQPSNYNSSADGTNAYSNLASHAHSHQTSQQQQAQQRYMNLSSHTYSSGIDGGDQALYNLLHSSLSG